MEPDKQSEYDAAEEFEGTRVPFSGATFLGKLDVVSGGKFNGYLIENKYTTKKSYSLNKHYIRECERLARREGKKCFMRVDYEGQKYIVIRQDWFQELFNG